MFIFNDHPSAVRISDALTEPVVRAAIQTYESRRLQQYWTETLGQRNTTTGNIRAFELNKEKDPLHAKHLTAKALQMLIGTEYKNTHQAINKIRKEGDYTYQYKKLQSILPSTREEAISLLKIPQLAIAPDLTEILVRCGSVELFLNTIINELRTDSAQLYFPFRYHEFLASLWSKDLIQYPFDIYEWTSRWKWAALTSDYWVGYDSARFIKHCISFYSSKSKAKKREHFAGTIYTFLAISNIKSTDLLTDENISKLSGYMLERIDDINNNQSSNNYAHRRSRVLLTANALRKAYNEDHPTNAIRLVKPQVPPNELAMNSGTFSWLVSAAPHLSEWADLCQRYIAQLTTATTSGQITRINAWLKYLTDLPSPPLHPLQVIRRDHIRNPTDPKQQTYYTRLLEQKKKKSTKNSELRELRDFFDWFITMMFEENDPAADTFKNPVAVGDNFGNDDRPRQSVRDALPGFVLEEMKETLIEDDFAFAKTLNMCNVHVINNQTKLASVEFFPGYAICMYLMLEAPIRSHQSRWFDSGELDEYILDHANGEFKINPSIYAIRGRREGVLELHSDEIRNDKWFGLWVNTNKTQAFEREEHGYSIPFASDTSVKMVATMLEWQRTYLPPISEPIAYYAANQENLIRQAIVEKGPQVAPLFRDPATFTAEHPIKYSQLASFYSKLLLEVQERIKKRYGHDIRLAEVVDTTRGKQVKWLVDLHTLRISGITSMIENGVPLEVVSQFAAGHATVVMTLHYLKYSPAKLRDFLKQAKKAAEENSDFVGSEIFFEKIDEFAPFLLTQSGAGVGPGIEALKEATGLLSVRADGICPGTSCASGGPVDSTRVKHGPVPGGARCGLCRYWITGPAHLLGQVTEVNNLAYRIRKSGLEIAALSDQKINLEDEGEKRKAFDVGVRIDNMRLALGLDLDEWAARYRYAADSVTLMDRYLAMRSEDGQTPVPMLVAELGELKVTLESAHEFVLLDQITQLNEFVCGHENREAQLEKNQILSKMMDANGIRPFLLSLSKQHALEAGNLLSSLILQQIEGRLLDDVLNGRLPVSDFPAVSRAIKVLERKAAGLEVLPWKDLIESLEQLKSD